MKSFVFNPIVRLQVDRCPACGAGLSALSDQSLVYRQDAAEQPFQLSRCNSCSHRFLSDPPTLESIGSYYETSAGQLMHDRGSRIFEFLRRKLIALEFESFVRRIGPNARLLDIGAGDGSVCDWFSRQRVNVFATDIYPSSSWHYSTIPYSQADITSPSELGSLMSSLSVNSITMRHVLEHFYHPREVFQTFKDSGIQYVSITVPNYHSRMRRLARNNWCMWDPPRHLQHFTKNSLIASASSAGYACMSLRTYGFDELLTSIYRYLSLTVNYKNPSNTKLIQYILDLVHHKSPLVAISSAVSYPLLNTVLSASFALKS